MVDARTLAALEESNRLKTSLRSDGVIPGEAACVCLVTPERVSPSPCAVVGLGFAMETATVLNDEPLLGQGMASAAAMALGEAGIGMHQVDFRLADSSGESYGFEELVLAQLRLMRARRESQDLWQPAGSIGDCGAAAGLVQLAWIEQAVNRGYAPGATALAHGSTPAGRRAAAVVRSEGPSHAA
jgi:3-oxoacyl-[acyl-carrier-protein] synthase-1